MKFTINRLELLKKLRNVQLAISNKTTITILTGLKLEVTKTYLKITGSNSNISIESKIFVDDENANLEIEETGSIVLQPARFFSDIINKLPDELFTFEVNTQLQASISSTKIFDSIEISELLPVIFKSVFVTSNFRPVKIGIVVLFEMAN